MDVSRGWGFVFGQAACNMDVSLGSGLVFGQGSANMDISLNCGFVFGQAAANMDISLGSSLVFGQGAANKRGDLCFQIFQTYTTINEELSSRVSLVSQLTGQLLWAINIQPLRIYLFQKQCVIYNRGDRVVMKVA